MRRMMVLSLITVVIFFAAVSSVLAANTYDPLIQDRIAEQQKRIDEGIASGKLTRAEADILQDNLNRLKDEEAKLKADGRLTARERARLNRQLDHNNNMIMRKKHNPIRRF